MTTIGHVPYLASPPIIGAIAGVAGLRAALAGLAVTGLLLAAGTPLIRGRVAAPARG